MTGPPVPFFKLPLNKDVPNTRLNAWGAYGNDDERGFLNRQTDEIVKKAAESEIKTGKRISLNAPLDYQKDKPFFGRQAFHKDVYQKGTRFVNDDTWTFNTQSSSQWDGFRHFAYQKAGLFYNNTTMDDIHKAENRPENFLGIHNFAEQGIVGRGILVDFARWRERQTSNKELAEFECFKASPIKLEWIKQILQEQETEVRFGDILIVRSGFMAAYLKLSSSEVSSLIESNPPPVCGVEQSDEGLQWIWENFSAVAGDQPAFERYVMHRFPVVPLRDVQFPVTAALLFEHVDLSLPLSPTSFLSPKHTVAHPLVLHSSGGSKWADYVPPPDSYPALSSLGWSMHEVLLAGWGCPIGELFDLEKLGEHCEKEKRWSFFVTSEVVNVPGGVASPPNILAIF